MQETGAQPRGWRIVGQARPDAVREARLQLHHLVQLIPSFAQRFVPAEDEDRHRSMTWDRALRAFRSRTAGEAGNLYLVVRPLPLEIELRAVGDGHAYVLPGHSLPEAYQWAERELGLLLGIPEVRLEPPEYELPGHRVTSGALFDASPLALEELGHWYDNATWALRRLAADCPSSSPVTAWPHHFDVATLVPLDPEGASTGRTVGVGFSPGDETYPDPYWYVSPYPYPWNEPCPDLTHGHWHTGDYLAAILPSTLRRDGGGVERVEAASDAASVEHFLREALAMSQALLADKLAD